MSRRKPVPSLLQCVPDIFDGILEDLDPLGRAGIYRFSFALFLFFDSRPVRMIGPVVERLGVRHEAKNPAGGVTDPGDVIE